jgi:hypothetical protein
MIETAGGLRNGDKIAEGSGLDGRPHVPRTIG